MTRLHASGFEIGSVTAGVEVASAGGTACSAYTTTKRSGAYSLRALASTSFGWVEFSLPADGTGTNGQRRSRVYVQLVTAPSANTPIIEHSEGATSGWQVMLLTNGALRAIYKQDGTTAAGGDFGPLTVGQWYRVELYSNWDTNAGEIRVDGSTWVTASGTLGMGCNAIRVGIGTQGTNVTSGEVLFDDLAVNNASGSQQASWPGAGSIVHLPVDSAGDSAPSTGTFADIDEAVPPNTTDEITLSSTATTGYFNCVSSASAGIGASDAVTCVGIGGYVRGATATACNWIGRIKSQASGTAVSGSTRAIATTTHTAFSTTTAEKQHSLWQHVDPQAGGAWTPALLDTVQIGFGSSDVTPNPACSYLWACVEYVPSGAAASLRRYSLTLTGVG